MSDETTSAPEVEALQRALRRVETGLPMTDALSDLTPASHVQYLDRLLSEDYDEDEEPRVRLRLLEAEIARLRGVLDAAEQHVKIKDDAIHGLGAEIARLRAVLRRLCDHLDGTTGLPRMTDALHEVQQALRGTP